jgi:hypothetical protein
MNMRKGFRRGVALWLGVVATAAYGQALTDPTRPPAAFGSPMAEAESDGPMLQSIIRSNRSKPAAIINGEYVALGGHVGEARLVKIGEDSVTLKSAEGTQILMLAPGVEITPAGSDAGKGKKAATEDRNKGK